MSGDQHGHSHMPVTEWILDGLITYPAENWHPAAAFAYFVVSPPVIAEGAMVGFLVDEVNNNYVQPFSLMIQGLGGGFDTTLLKDILDNIQDAAGDGAVGGQSDYDPGGQQVSYPVDAQSDYDPGGQQVSYPVDGQSDSGYEDDGDGDN